MRVSSCRVRFLCIAFFALALVASASESTCAFDIPDGNAPRTLKDFAAQGQCEIVFSPEITADVMTHAVRGQLTPREALARMLAQTELVFTQDNTGAFAVRRLSPPHRAREPEPTARQTKPPPELVTLSPFVVPADSVGRYTATEATSGSRVRISLLDSPQSVSVVTRALIDDIGAARMLDAAKYVAGISESTIPNAQDRTNIRGFQTDGATIDGFNFFSYANIDPVIVDRIEVVKGPNAILSPQIVQGTINLISRKPTFADGGYVAARIGRYNADRVEFDLNRVVVPGKLAARVVAAAQHSHDQAEGNFNHSQVAMPMFTYAFGNAAAVTLQAQFYNDYSAAYGGLPIDLAVGTADRAHLLDGVPTDLDLYTTMAARHSAGAHYRLLFTAEPIEHLSVRVAANAARWHGSSVGINLGVPVDANGQPVATLALDPATGAWRGTGALNSDPVFPRAGGVVRQSRTYYNLQNDYAYRRNVGPIDSTTVAGYMLNYLSNPLTAMNVAVAPLAIRHAAGLPGYTPVGMNGSSTIFATDQQLYLNEVISADRGRFVATFGIADAWYKAYVNDHLLYRTASNTPTARLPSGGLVFKPVPGLALYTGFSRQSTALQPSTTVPLAHRLQTGKQHEVGVRTDLLDGRLFASVAYFSIAQTSFAVPNPGNAAIPPPTPALPPLYTDLHVDGVEFELRAALTSALSVIGSATTLHARNPVGQPFRGVAERTAAAWIDYAVPHGHAWRGLSVGFGVDYVGRRAGDFPSGTPTTASTPEHLIMPQPSFWLPARTLLSVGVTYRWRRDWKFQLNIDNLLNEQYLAASTSRNTVFPGTPFNPRFGVTYEF